MTVVHGGQGYGKTALVADWLERQADSVVAVWLTVTPELNRPTVLRRSLAAESARFGALNVDVDDPLRPLTRLLDGVSDTQRVVLVLDDVQHLQERQILVGLVDLVRRRRNLHLVACTRSQHPLANLAASVVDVEAIPPRDLLLTVAEIGDLAEVMEVRLSASDVQRLHEAVGGWIGALRAVLIAMAGGACGVPVASAEEYVREVVVPGIGDEETLTELMRFSLASRLTHGLIRELSERPDPQQSVALVEAPGLAQRRYTDSDVELVVPSMVRMVLCQEFAVRNPAGVKAMHARLAAWYATRGGDDFLWIAFQHAAAGQDWARMDDLWDAHEAAFGMRDPAALTAVLRALPEDILVSRPSMLVGLVANAAAVGDSDLDGRRATLRAYFETSARFVPTHLDELRLPDLVYVGTWHMVGLRMAGGFAEAARFGGELEARIAARRADGASPGGRLRWFDLQYGLTWTLLGEHDTAIRYYERCWQHRIGLARYIPANAAANLAMTYALRAERDRAELWLARYREFDTSQEWGHQLVGIGAHVAAGLLALDQLDDATCRAVLEQLGDGTAPVELWPYVAYLLARYGLQFGDPVTALVELDSARRAHQPDRTDHGAAALMLTRAAADLLLAGGENRRAAELLARAGEARSPMLAVSRARATLATGNYAEAARIAASAEPRTYREHVEVLLVEALAAYRMNDLDRSRRQAVRGFALAARHHLRAPLVGAHTHELSTLAFLAGKAPDLLPDEPTRLRGLQRPSLTRREREIAVLLAGGVSRQQIADQLYVSINTIKKQLVALYRKLDVSTRAEAVERLHHHGFVH